MRKTALILLSVLVIVASVFALITCAKNGDKPSNARGEPTPDNDEAQPMATLEEHSWELVAIVKEATCTEAGKQIYECSVCHEKVLLDIDAIDHDYGELHKANEPTCEKDGNVAYYQCSKCFQYFDSDKKPIDAVVRPSNGAHVWNLADGNVNWIWPETYADFLEIGVKVELNCAVCTAKTERIATAVKDTARSVEPTYTERGLYIFTAEVTVDGTNLSAEHTYDLPTLPDGKPERDYALVGDFDGNSKLLDWNTEEQLFQTTQSFAVSQTWKIMPVGSSDAYSVDIDAVTYEQNLAKPATDLYTVTNGDGVAIRMEYACTLVIKFNFTTGKISIHVTEIKEKILEKKEAECYLSGGINDERQDDPDFKFVKQEDGTYKLSNVTLRSDVSKGLYFKVIFDGVEVIVRDDFQLNFPDSDVIFMQRSGYIMATGTCTINLTYDPATNTLTIDFV